MPAKKATKKVAKTAATKTAKKAAKKVAAAPEVEPKPAKKAAKKATKAVREKSGPSTDEIAEAAYLNYRRRVEEGHAGNHEEDWLKAEKALSKAKK